MASESSDRNVSVSLPSDLAEWLDRKATDLDLDRQDVVVQLLAAYRATAELDGDVESVAATAMGDPGEEGEDVETLVRDVVAERIPDIATAVGEQLEVADAVGEEGDDEAGVEAVEAVEERLATEIDSLESDFDEKIRDVRERVIQVKREADAKAPAEHAHPALDDLEERVDGLAASLEGIDATLDGLEERVEDIEDGVAAHDDDDLSALDRRLDAVEDAADRLDDVEERLRTVAWVVSDLRDAQQHGSAGTKAIDRLKRSAAELDVDRAVCGNCAEAVDIALLSEPRCPHCDATVGDVELPGGLFGKPKLSVARRLEAGPDEERSNVPDAADRGRGE